MNVDAGARLPCGTWLAALVEQVADNLAPANPEHQVSCSHCQQTLGELEELWGRVRKLARKQVRAPYRIVQAVMRGIRAERTLPSLPLPLEAVVPQLVRHALLQQERGSTRIADSVLARIAALSLCEFPAVEPAVRAAEMVGGRFLGRTTSGIHVTVSERGVVVELRITVDYGPHLPSLVEAIRRNIVDRLIQMTGLVVQEVNVLVEDVRLPLDYEEPVRPARPLALESTELSAPRRF